MANYFLRSNQEEMTGHYNCIQINFYDFDSGHQVFSTHPHGKRSDIKAFSVSPCSMGLCTLLPFAPRALNPLLVMFRKNKETCQRGGKSPNNHRWPAHKFNLKSFFIIENIKIKAIMPKGKHRLKPPMFHSLFLRRSPKH